MLPSKNLIHKFQYNNNNFLKKGSKNKVMLLSFLINCKQKFQWDFEIKKEAKSIHYLQHGKSRTKKKKTKPKASSTFLKKIILLYTKSTAFSVD